MSYLKKLEKFNTLSMSEEVVLSVSTGRDKLIATISKIINDNLFKPNNMQHVVLTGPRGMGKSFLIRYFQIITQKWDIKNSFIDFALLPEEQHNINLPSQFIDELLDAQKKTMNKSASWNNTDESWESSLIKLTDKINEGVKKYKNYLFVAGVENLDILINNVFSSDIEQSRLRQLLSDTKHFMLLGSSKKCDIDTDYNKRLFYSFQKYSLDPWTEGDYTKYFNRRYKLIKMEKPGEFDKKDIRLLRNKLKAISKFTGGSPRMAVVLTNLLFDEDAVSTAQTLNDIVEDLSPYYQDLLEKMPKKSKILFDALVRSEENISQSKLAELVGAKQSDISQAFKWLLGNNYITGHKNKGEKFYRYSVADRVFVLFYYKRFMYQGLEFSHIKILSEFLISFYDSRELSLYALKYLRGTNQTEGIEFARLVFDKEKIRYDSINWQNKEDVKNTLNRLINSKADFNKVEDVSIVKNYNKEFEKNIEPHLKVLERCEKERNVTEQIKELRQIGLNYSELKQFEKAINYHQQALQLSVKEDNISEQAWNLGQIGWNYNELQQFKKAIEYYQKALELSVKEDNISMQAWNLGQIGLNYNELQQFEKAIEFHQQALELEVKEDNISMQAWNLGQIGRNYFEQQQFEKAIEFHQQALQLNVKEDNITMQAWNLEHIGLNHKELQQFEQAIEFHQQALQLSVKEDNISMQAVYLGEIGLNYKELQQFEKAINYHQQVLQLSVKEDNITMQALNLGEIGWNYYELQQFEKAIEFHQQALQLRVKEDNISQQAWNLGQIGLNYNELKQFEKAIEYYQQALQLSKKEDNISVQAVCLGEIGWNYKELQQFEKATEYHQQALQLRVKEDNISQQAWNLGQIGSIYLLDKKEDNAWKLLAKYSDSNILGEQMFKEYGDAIYFKEKWEGKAEAYRLAINILMELHEKSLKIKSNKALKNLFAGLLSMKLPMDLLEDICYEAKNIFGRDDNIIIDATLHTIKYLEEGKNEKYLRQINPDIAIAVKAIVDEGKL